MGKIKKADKTYSYRPSLEAEKFVDGILMKGKTGPSQLIELAVQILMRLPDGERHRLSGALDEGQLPAQLEFKDGVDGLKKRHAI